MRSFLSPVDWIVINEDPWFHFYSTFCSTLSTASSWVRPCQKSFPSSRPPTIFHRHYQPSSSLTKWRFPKPWSLFSYHSPLSLPIFSFMTRRPEDQGRANQKKGERLLWGAKTDNKDPNPAILSVRQAIHWVPTIPEGQVKQQAEGLARHGQPRNLMSTHKHMWESTTIAGILLAILRVSTVIRLIHRSDGSTALFQYVHRKSSTSLLTMTISLTAMASTPAQPSMLVFSPSLSPFAWH